MKPLRTVDRTRFFNKYRTLFRERLTQEQVDALELLLYYIERDDRHTMWEHFAYLLGSFKLETNNTYKPVTEAYWLSTGAAYRWCENKYGYKTDKGKELGNTAAGDGFKYRGHGLIQITGKSNFRKMSPVIGLDLVNDPDATLRLDVSYTIASYGCAHGIFTGRRLNQYIYPGHVDYRNARRVVNGMNKARSIEWNSRMFLQCLT